MQIVFLTKTLVKGDFRDILKVAENTIDNQFVKPFKLDFLSLQHIVIYFCCYAGL